MQRPSLCPYTTLFRSPAAGGHRHDGRRTQRMGDARELGEASGTEIHPGPSGNKASPAAGLAAAALADRGPARYAGVSPRLQRRRSEEHTSELQSLAYL